MLHEFAKDETVARRQVALQGIEQLFPAGLEALAGQIEYLVHRGAGDQRLDHSARRRSMHVADNHAEPDATVGQHFVQAVLFRRELPDQFLTLTRNQAQ